jgi:hypothetical protein
MCRPEKFSRFHQADFAQDPYAIFDPKTEKRWRSEYVDRPNPKRKRCKKRGLTCGETRRFRPYERARFSKIMTSAGALESAPIRRTAVFTARAYRGERPYPALRIWSSRHEDTAFSILQSIDEFLQPRVYHHRPAFGVHNSVKTLHFGLTEGSDIDLRARQQASITRKPDGHSELSSLVWPDL